MNKNNKLDNPGLTISILWKTACKAMQAFHDGKPPANGLIGLYQQTKLQTVLQIIIDS